jgi:hypothetical protein
VTTRDNDRFDLTEEATGSLNTTVSGPGGEVKFNGVEPTDITPNPQSAIDWSMSEYTRPTALYQ